MATTTTLRRWWSEYECRDDLMVPYTSFGMTSGVAEPSLEAWQALDTALSATGYTAVSSWCYNCRNIKGSRFRSLHSYGIARDYDPFALGNPFVGGPFGWHKTKFAEPQILAAEAIRTRNGKQAFTWGGRWKTRKDYMHFQIDVRPSDLATGIDWSTVAGAEGAPIPAPTPDEGEEVMKLGDTGPDVARLQDLLRARLRTVDSWDDKQQPETTGVYDEATVAAVRAYQEFEGQTVTGIAGIATWSILAAQVINDSTPSPMSDFI